MSQRCYVLIMAFCSNCGNKLNDGAQFCPNCGQQVNQQPKAKEQPKGFIEAFKEGWKEADSESDNKKENENGRKKSASKSDNKKEDENDWKYGCGCMFIILLVIGFFVEECSGNDSNAPKPFEAIEDGRAAYCIDSSQYANSDIRNLDLIVMYEGNSRKDCKAMGVNSEGHVFEENGKWEKRDAPFSSSRYYYYLNFKFFKLLLRDDSVVCYYKGNDDDGNAIQRAWTDGRIGKIKQLDENKERAISQKFQNKKEDDKPLKGSKDLSFIKSKIGHSVWTYTPEYGNPIPYWYRLVFNGSSCDVYHALPKDGQWKKYFSSPYSVTEKRLDDGKRYVFVYLKYAVDTDDSLYEPPFPTGINITEGSFVFGAMGAIGYIDEKDYKWD